MIGAEGTRLLRDREVTGDPAQIFEDLTAYENLDYFGRLYGLKGNLLKERIDEALRFTGLTDRQKDRPKGFSGGMKRRLNIGEIAERVYLSEGTIRNYTTGLLEKLKLRDRTQLAIFYLKNF